MIFGLLKERILEIFDERLGAICVEVIANVGSHILSLCEQEIDLDHLGKRGPDQVKTREGLKKRPKTSDQRLGSQQDKGQYGSFGKLHDGVCLSRGRGCYKCGRIDHVSKDCP